MQRPSTNTNMYVCKSKKYEKKKMIIIVINHKKNFNKVGILYYEIVLEIFSR
jgi:hypothetical protein